MYNLTVSREEGERGNSGEWGDHQGKCMKDTWTKPKGEGLSLGSGYGWGGGHGGVKMETIVLEQQ